MMISEYHQLVVFRVFLFFIIKRMFIKLKINLFHNIFWRNEFVLLVVFSSFKNSFIISLNNSKSKYCYSFLSNLKSLAKLFCFNNVLFNIEFILLNLIPNYIMYFCDMKQCFYSYLFANLNLKVFLKYY